MAWCAGALGLDEVVDGLEDVLAEPVVRWAAGVRWCARCRRDGLVGVELGVGVVDKATEDDEDVTGAGPPDVVPTPGDVEPLHAASDAVAPHTSSAVTARALTRPVVDTRAA